MAKMKAKVWCEIPCGNCGTIVGRFYRDSSSISAIRQEAHNWIYDEQLGINLCPDCIIKLKGGAKNGK